MTNRFKSAAQRIKEMEDRGEEIAQINHEAGELTREEKFRLEKGAKMGDQASADMLVEIDTAWETVQTDPFARQANLRKAILDFGTHALPDPERFLKLYFAASARTMKSRQLALPNLATKKQRELKRGERVLYFPYTDKRHAMYVSLHRLPVVATEPADLPTLQAMLRQQSRLRRRISEELFQSALYLANPRDAAWQAGVFLPETAILPMSVSEKARKDGDRRQSVAESFSVVSESETELVYQRNGGETLYHAFRLSEAEIFLVGEKNPDSEGIVSRLRQLAASWDLFWNNGDEQMDAGAIIEVHLDVNRGHVISLEEFLRGVPGVTAVRHDAWRAGKKTVPVDILFERLSEEWGHAWRWSLCNREAVDVLFEGRMLKFHNYSRGAVPRFLEDMLRTGTPVTAPLNSLPLERMEAAAG